MTDTLLELRNVRKRFVTKRGMFGRKGVVDAVRGVDLSVPQGKVLGLAGESGSGKSTVARLVLRIIEPDEGTVTFDGQDLGALEGKALRRARSLMPMVFQDPYASLDPTKMVLDIVAEPVRVHRPHLKADVEQLVIEQLERVGLQASHRHRYPYEFSGGQRQRIAIARALISEPKLVIADEPVSALDVSTQAQVLNLLADLRRERNLGMLFISHDLAVLRHISDEIAVMFRGRIVESGPSDSIFNSPQHPYTQELLNAVPRISGRLAEPQWVSPAVTDAAPVDDALQSGGCAYRKRCPHAFDLCSSIDPALSGRGDSTVACHLTIPPTQSSTRSQTFPEGTHSEQCI